MKHTLFLVLIMVLGSHVTTVAIAAAPRFTLEDQFERQHSQASVFSDRPVVMLGGDERKTRFAIKKWVGQLNGRIGSKARLVGLVDLDGIPFFVPNSSVRGALKEEFPKQIVLCDWDGSVYPKLGFVEDTLVAVRVFRADGSLLGQIRGEPTYERIARVVDLVEKAAR